MADFSAVGIYDIKMFPLVSMLPASGNAFFRRTDWFASNATINGKIVQSATN